MADDAAFGALEFLRGQPFRLQLGEFREQFFLAGSDFVRRGADVEGKITGVETEQLIRAHVVGETEFVADSEKDARTLPGICVIKQIERVPVRTEYIGAAVADQQACSFGRVSVLRTAVVSRSVARFHSSGWVWSEPNSFSIRARTSAALTSPKTQMTRLFGTTY